MEELGVRAICSWLENIRKTPKNLKSKSRILLKTSQAPPKKTRLHDMYWHLLSFRSFGSSFDARLEATPGILPPTCSGLVVTNSGFNKQKTLKNTKNGLRHHVFHGKTMEQNYGKRNYGKLT